MVNKQQIDIEEEVAYVERLQRTIRHLRRELQEAQSEGAYLRERLIAMARELEAMADTVRDMLGPHPAVRQLRALRAQIERRQSEYQEVLDRLDADLEARRRAEEEAAWAWYERQRQDGGKRR